MIAEVSDAAEELKLLCQTHASCFLAAAILPPLLTAEEAECNEDGRAFLRHRAAAEEGCVQRAVMDR